MLKDKPELTHDYQRELFYLRRLAYFHRGTIHLEHGHHTEAEKDILKMDLHEGHLLLGNYFFRQNNPKFQRHLSQALSTPPTYSNDKISKLILPLQVYLSQFTKSTELNIEN